MIDLFEGFFGVGSLIAAGLTLVVGYVFYREKTSMIHDNLVQAIIDSYYNTIKVNR